MFKEFADSREAASLSTRLRRKRFALFRSLIASVPQPFRILDVGGTQSFWEIMGMCEEPGFEIWILDLKQQQPRHPNLKCIAGDARDMKQFRNKAFEVVFSNSVLEHVGDYADQRRMAEEVRRVGDRYFIQTPNRYFPIEPHYLFPFFQFLPRWAKIWLARRFRLGWFGVEAVDSIRLISKRELRRMFPGGRIIAEKFGGLNKSFTVYDGWDSR